MLKYHPGSCTGAVNNSAITGILARDISRADPSALPPNFSLNSRCDEMATSTEEDPKKKLLPSQLVKLEKAFKMAEQWVNHMSKSSVNEKSPLVELEGHPSRLGIGATVPKESEVMRSNNPVEQKLLAKLHTDKRKVVKREEDIVPSAKDRNVDEDSEEEELESKTRAFAKKRPLSLTSPVHAKKKHR